MHKCKVIAIANQKGGVGKTTTTFNLGVGLVRNGFRVLLIDLDPQGNLTMCCGYKNPDDLKTTVFSIMMNIANKEDFNITEGILNHVEGVDLIPANIKLMDIEQKLAQNPVKELILKKYLDRIKARYDYIIIDCMPGLGIATVNALSAADSVIITLQSQYFALKGLGQLTRTIRNVQRELNPRLKIDGILLTLVARNTNLAHDTEKLARSVFGEKIRIFNSKIPLTVKCAETNVVCRSIFSYKRRSRAAQEFADFTREVIDLG